MDEQDDITQHSATERQLRRLIVPAPAAYATGQRIDVIHDPDPDLLQGDPR